MIVDEVKSQVASTLKAILDMEEEASEHLGRAATLSAQVGTRCVVYDAMEHEIFDQI